MIDDDYWPPAGDPSPYAKPYRVSGGMIAAIGCIALLGAIVFCIAYSASLTPADQQNLAGSNRIERQAVMLRTCFPAGIYDGTISGCPAFKAELLRELNKEGK